MCCWRRLLRVPWTARRSNQSILKEINPEYSLEGLMLKLQYFGHLMRRTDSLEKTLMLGNTEGRRRRGRQRMRQLDGITNSLDMNLSKDWAQESSPAPQFESIDSLVLNFLYGLTITCVHDYGKNHNFDYTDLCWQSHVSAF